MKRWPWPGIVTSVVLLVPLVIGAVLAVGALSQSPLESAQPVEATIGTVESAQRDDTENSSAIYVPGAARSVTSQSSGVVTKVAISVGESVSDGSTPIAVDGLPVTAYGAPSPLFRDIASGLEGDDVAIAQQLLHDAGFLDSDIDGVAGSATVNAIVAFNKERGYGKTNRVLAVGSLLWIPDDSGTPSSVTVQIGDTVSAGTELYVASVEPSRISVDVAAEDVSRVVTVNGVTAALPAGETSVSDPAEVEALADVVGEDQAAPATVALASPRKVGTVPSPSVVTDAQGRACFFSSVDGGATEIDATTGAFGVVDVDPELVGTPVLVNPRDTRSELTCD